MYSCIYTLYILNNRTIQPIIYGIRASKYLKLKAPLLFFKLLFSTMSETHNSPATNSETITVSATPTLLNVNMTNVAKLTGSNFLMWSRQVLAVLDCYDLAGYIEGSIVVPPQTTMTDDEITTNPSYTLWKRQNCLIFSALLGAITSTIQLILSTATTAAEI